MIATTVAILGEMRKGLMISWTYKFNFISSLITLSIVFIGLSFILGGGHFDANLLASQLLGFISWAFAFWAIIDMSSTLKSEISTGTLEQMAMSRSPLGLILLSRTITNFFTTTIQVLLLLFFARIIFGINFPFRIEAIPVFVLMLIGILGFGFMIAGATLVLKQFDALATLIQNLLIFLNGTALSVTAMPAWLAIIARLLPSTQGVVVLRDLLIRGEALSYIWNSGDLQILIIHSLVYLTIGWLVFKLCETTAKNRGNLGQY